MYYYIMKNSTRQTGPVQTRRKAKTKRVMYDSAWKDIIEHMFEGFLEFLFPEIHGDIDFSKPPQFLDTELRSIKPYGKIGNRIADKLALVTLRSGEAARICIFTHLEVQGTRLITGLFEERSYIYNYRIFDKNIVRHPGGDPVETVKNARVITLAVLTDEDENYRPDQYHFKKWGFELLMKIPMVKLIDYKNNEALKKKLETSTNPMVMVVKAVLKNHELKKADGNQKSTVKYELIKECYTRGYDKAAIAELLQFIDWLIRLPLYLDEQLKEKISVLEEDYKMHYVTSWQRIGEKIGKKEGKLERNFEIAKEMLMDGFQTDVISKYTTLTEAEIRTLIN